MSEDDRSRVGISRLETCSSLHLSKSPCLAGVCEQLCLLTLTKIWAIQCNVFKSGSMWLKFGDSRHLLCHPTQHNTPLQTLQNYLRKYLSSLLHLIFQADEFCIMSLFKDGKTYFGVKTPNKKEENWNWLWIDISALPPIPYASCFFPSVDSPG